MNSSFLLWGPLLVGMSGLVGTVALALRYGPPQDTPRTLALLLSGAFAALWLSQGAAVFGVYPLFWYEGLYGVLLGLMAFSFPAYTYLGVVDRPGQIQRKVMWRLPLVGALLGHFLTPGFMGLLLIAGWTAALALLWADRGRQRQPLRLLCAQLAWGALAYGLWRGDFAFAALAACVAWWTYFQRFLEAYLVKNLVRARVPPATGGP